MKRLFVLALFAFAFAANAQMTLNPNVTQDNIDKTICVPGWTATVRPPVAYTNSLKYRLLDKNDISRLQIREFELDHRVPLTLGGHPRDPKNLWLQAWYSGTSGWHGETDAHVKDVLEVRLNHLVCKRKMKLIDAQTCIYNDWRQCAKEHP